MPLSKKTEAGSTLGELLKDGTDKSLLRQQATKILHEEWSEICSLAEAKKLSDWLNDANVLDAIKCSINSPTKTYRYVLPTQLLSKLANPELDARCVQASRGGRGAFDARTIAHDVIVPFDQRNENVLGGSEEPYVSNPLRFPEISASHRSAQKNKHGWDYLCMVLNAAQERDKTFIRAVFRQALTEVYRRLGTVRVVYPIPGRISLDATVKLIDMFLRDHSGGDRLLALCSALFVIIGKRFGLYQEVRRGKITAADEPSGMLADLECTSGKKIVLAVEVKDRQLTLRQLRAKLRGMKEQQVSEIFFMAQGVPEQERTEIETVVDREFANGQNVYITDLSCFSRTALSLLGEAGRRDFLDEVKNQLEKYKSEITHRRAWASLLESI